MNVLHLKGAAWPNGGRIHLIISPGWGGWALLLSPSSSFAVWVRLQVRVREDPVISEADYLGNVGIKPTPQRLLNPYLLARTVWSPHDASWMVTDCVHWLCQPIFWLLIVQQTLAFPILPLCRIWVSKLSVIHFAVLPGNSGKKKKTSAKHYLLIEWKNKWIIELRQNVRRNQVA